LLAPNSLRKLIFMRSYKTSIAQFTCAAVFSALTGLNSSADIVGPYTADVNTLHLWHMDQIAVPVLDSVSTGGTNLTSLQNLATLGNASFPGFGSALSAYGQGPTVAGACYLAPRTLPNDATTFTYAGPNGAFTYEAVVQITYNPSQNLGPAASGGNGRNQPLTILAGEGNSGPLRLFQFRVDPIGYNGLSQPSLEFINVNQGTSVQNIVVPIPFNDGNPDDIVQNGWYHVAVTYNGQPNTPGNLNFYWTLMDSNRTAATLIGSMQMNLSLATGLSPNLVVGNTGRNPGGNSANPVNANFLGLIDEVRISKVALGPGQMMFSAPTITIDVDVTNQVTVLGQTVNFAVSASGVPPLRYQWRHDLNNIVGATQSVYTIPAVSLSDVGNYDVVITNNYTSITSSVGTLSLRTPINLTWVGFGWPWDVNNSPGWQDPSFNNVVYTEGDNVTFDSAGASWTPVQIAGPVYPSSVTVNSDTDYTFTTSSGGGIYGMTGITKTGAGNLILDVNNSYAGPTLIQSGTIQVGAGGTRGTLGTGSVTNNGGLIFDRIDSLTVANNIVGSGGLTNIGAAGNVTLTGSNTFSGAIAVLPPPSSSGAITLAGPQALGQATDIVLTAHAGGGGITGTRLALQGGLSIPANRTLWMLGTATAPDLRCNLYTASGTNSWNGPIVLGFGDGISALAADAANAELDVNGPISSGTSINQLTLRGTGGRGFVNGTITMPNGQVNKTDSSTWTISSTGNSWVSTDIAAGSLRMGANNIFPSTAFVNFTAPANLDLAGYSQQIAGLNGTNAAFIVGSSSTNSDSLLAINAAFPSVNWGVIQDSLSGGTRKVSLSLLSGSLTLTNINTYSGDTTIAGGTLYLLGAGSIANSRSIDIESGATLDVSGRLDGSLTGGAAQTIKGNGAFNVTGNLTNTGTIELKLNKSGASLTSDRLQVSSQLAYGGILKLDVSGDPLASGDTFTLFSASGYSGAFSNFSPSTPGPGLAWYSGTLALDGKIRVLAVPIATATSVSGTNITVSGYNGPASLNYVVIASINATTPRDFWIPISTNTFDASGNFSFTVPILKTQPKRFYSIWIP
jgi:autotransporter-associated beta strand protein